MNRDDYEIVAARVLSGEANADEARQFEALLAEERDLAEDFEQLRSTWVALREASPLAAAVNASPEEPPAQRRQAWEAALERKFGTQAPARTAAERRGPEAMPASFGQTLRWLAARYARSIRLAGAALCCLLAVAAAILLVERMSAARSQVAGYFVLLTGRAQVRGEHLSPENGVSRLRPKDQVQLPPDSVAALVTPRGLVRLRGPGTFRADAVLRETNEHFRDTNATLARALFAAPQETLGLLVTKRSSGGVRIYSPVGLTSSSAPILLWHGDSAVTFEVSLRDALNPEAAPFEQSAAVPPLLFSVAWPGRTLTPDGLYRLRISETGKPFTATEITFRTLAAAQGKLPETPGERLLAAYEILVSNPSRLGDVLAALLTLPPELARSELALRMKLFAFGQLGYHEDFDAALASLRYQSGQ